MNKLINFIKNNKRKTIFISAICLFVLYFIFSDYGLIKRISLSSQLSNKMEEIQSYQQETDSLKTIIHKLKTDSLEIERIGREKYGMTKSKEEVYYIKTKK